MRPRARIEVEVCDETKAKALYEALLVEASNPPDPTRGEMRVEKRETRIIIDVNARDYSSARALLNASLTLLATLWDTLREVDASVQKENRS